MGEAVQEYRVSVAISALDDAGLIGETVRAALAVPAMQVVVVDGGSVDGTGMIAQNEGARVIRSHGRERGRRLRGGLSAVDGDAVVVITPGARLSAEAVQAVREAFRAPEVAGGTLELRLIGWPIIAAPLNRLYSLLRGVGLMAHNSPWFAWRTAAESAEAFKSLRVFEDVSLLKRLQKQGKIVRLRATVDTIASHEIHRLFWTLMQVVWKAGVSARILGLLYRKPRVPAREERQEAWTIIPPPVRGQAARST